MIEAEHPEISIRRQCELVGLNRSSYYQQPTGETALNLELMRRIDEQYLKTPFYGIRRMTVSLQKAGYAINRKRVVRLMKIMGIQAIFPRKNLSKPGKEHRIYPYLLRGMEIIRPDQVWSADITYLPMAGGFMYLVAIIDWYSRYVLAWQVSNTLDTVFCLAALNQALTQGQPLIFNTDQGAQFTSIAFTNRLLESNIQISMDGRGRALDNIFIERLWRTVKYEDIYLKNYEHVPALVKGVGDYFHFYNTERPHQSLGYLTPADVYHQATRPMINHLLKNELILPVLWS